MLWTGIVGAAWYTTHAVDWDCWCSLVHDTCCGLGLLVQLGTRHMLWTGIVGAAWYTTHAVDWDC